MIQQSDRSRCQRETYVCQTGIDSSKIGRARFYKAFDYDEVDVLITNVPLDDKMMKICQNHGIEVIVA